MPLTVLRLRPSLTLISPLTQPSRVYLAYNPSTQLTAACKVISIASSNPAENEPPRPTRKELEKEVKVHRMLKHSNILEFLDAVLIEENSGWVPGLFVLLELAAGGDLFDKIGEWPERIAASPNSLTLNSVLCPQLLIVVSPTTSPTTFSTSFSQAWCATNKLFARVLWSD